MLINVKMPTIVGILTFMSRKILCSAELSMKKSFITSEPGLKIIIIGYFIFFFTGEIIHMMLRLCMKTAACPRDGAERSYRGWVESLRESMTSTFTGNTTRL